MSERLSFVSNKKVFLFQHLPLLYLNSDASVRPGSCRKMARKTCREEQSQNHQNSNGVWGLRQAGRAHMFTVWFGVFLRYLIYNFYL